MSSAIAATAVPKTVENASALTPTSTIKASSLSSSTSASIPASPARAQHHKAPKETAQMNVLGLDGTDLDILQTLGSGVGKVENDDRKMPPKPSPASSPKPTSRRKENARSVAPSRADAAAAAAENKNWWGKIIWGAKKDGELGETTNYTSLETPLGDGNLPRTRAAAVASSAAAVISAARSVDGNASIQSRATVEDQLREECSFFYQGIEDPIQQKRDAIRPLSSALDKMPRILASRDGAIFQAKYQRLNQSIVMNDTDDLELNEETRNTETIDYSSECSRNLSDIQNSSLFFKQNGRMLMRLPRDQMRLIMDQDLEPGILSVEQWRYVDDNEIAPSGDPVAATGPPLRYVMTVPDDLYRRVVSEMSYHLDPPYHGAFKCCLERESADIRLAVLILFVVMILLFIGTMDFPTD